MNLFLLLLPYTTLSPFCFQAHAAHGLTLPAHQRDTCRKAGEHIWSELVRGNLINVMRMKDDRNLRGFSFPLFSSCAWGARAPHCRADKLKRAEKRTVTVWMGETANNSVSDSETQQCCHRILRGTCWGSALKDSLHELLTFTLCFKKWQAINSLHFSKWVFEFIWVGKFYHSHVRWDFEKISLHPLTPQYNPSSLMSGFIHLSSSWAAFPTGWVSPIHHCNDSH